MDGRTAILKKIGENRHFFATGGRIPVPDRRRLLRRLERQLRLGREQVFSALNGDLHKSEFEATATELVPLLEALRFFIRRLPRLAAAKRCPVSPLNFPARGRIVPEPYGQVLVCATWNYPLLLALEPAVGALAAGNRVVLKLSDKSVKTMQFLKRLIEECFPEGEIIAVQNELSLEELLLEQRRPGGDDRGSAESDSGHTRTRGEKPLHRGS